MPSDGIRLRVEHDPGSIGRVFLKECANDIRGFCRIQTRRQSKAELCYRRGQQHIAGISRGRQPVDAGDRQLRPPSTIEHQLGQVVAHRRHAGL